MAQAAVGAAARRALASGSAFLTAEVPAILQLAAKALRAAPLPTTVEGWGRLGRAEWFQLAPILACLAVAAVVPLALLHSSGRPAPPRRQGSHGSFWLTRLLLLRAMAAIYLCAFLTSAFQSRAIFGSRGLMPAAFGSSGRPTPVFTALETHAGWAFDDCQLELVSWLGVLLALLQLCGTVVSCALPAALWVLYLSIVNCGGIVINYGWEWLTLEAGFLLIFLTPLCSSSPFPAAAPPSRLVLWLFRCKPHDTSLQGSCTAVPLRKKSSCGQGWPSGS